MSRAAFTVYLTPEQHEGLKVLAARRRRPMARLIREAVVGMIASESGAGASTAPAGSASGTAEDSDTKRRAHVPA